MIALVIVIADRLEMAFPNWALTLPFMSTSPYLRLWMRTILKISIMFCTGLTRMYWTGDELNEEKHWYSGDF